MYFQISIKIKTFFYICKSLYRFLANSTIVTITTKGFSGPSNVNKYTAICEKRWFKWGNTGKILIGIGIFSFILLLFGYQFIIVDIFDNSWPLASLELILVGEFMMTQNSARKKGNK